MSDSNLAQSILSGSHDPTIRGLELLISKLLRAGVMVSVLLIVAGMIIMFAQHPEYLSSSTQPARIVANHAELPHSVSALATRLYRLRGDAIITLGLLALMATPMLRVAVSLVTFVYHRDRIYALLTATVLCLLLLSLLLGKVE